MGKDLKPDNLKDIKDTTPNQQTVEILEGLLDYAKKGQLRSICFVCGWDDDQVSHAIEIDMRNTMRRMLSELVILQHNYVDLVGFKEQESEILRNLVYVDWD